MSYTKKENKFLGYIDSTLSNVYRNYPEFFEKSALLITCLDSDIDLSNNGTLLSMLKKRKCEYRIIGKSIYIASEQIRLVFERGGIFSHFDEIYLLNKEVKEEIKVSRQFTTDAVNFQEKIPNEFLEFFNKMNAVRYLSDGCGLNFACESETVAKDLISRMQRT